ncbi:MAG TPA: ATP-binding protein [Candidatus Binataceae bacterium]|nr:ATP-binding protein [Candidatus Binataceae bacterium]
MTSISDEALPVLLIEDNPGDTRLVREALSETRFARWRLTCRQTLSEGLELLGRESVVAVLLDLTLPDCTGAETIAQVHAAAPTMPIVILTGRDDEVISRDAVKAGAQDYLIKGLFDGGLLSRSLFYAIERARLREQLLKARDEALQAAKLKSEFLAIISHEMRTPMNAIIGPLELLIDTPLNREQAESAKTALTGSHAMLALIDDILDYSRLAGGELRMREVAFDLTDTLEAIVGDFVELAFEKGLALRVRNQTAGPLRLAGDPARLGQVLINLIGNAFKFTRHGEVAVAVSCESESALEANLRFEVADTGIGIANEIEKKLFAPFSQADGSSTRRFGGSGLGLAIAARIVELLHGEIGVESVLGCGSKFWFTARMRKAPPSMLKLLIAKTVAGTPLSASKPSSPFRQTLD